MIKSKVPDLEKEGKLLHIIKGRTMRDLVNQTNELKIPREDIVQILPESGQYVLFYYYG